MRILLDTHALLWWIFDDPKLPETARFVIRASDTDVFVSGASAWEVATKHRIGKLPEAASAATDLVQILAEARFSSLPVTVEHGLIAGGLPGPHRDPFGRMLIAQARCESLHVVTRDPVFATYGVDVLW